MITNSGFEFYEWVSAKLGTHDWFVGLLTQPRREQGYKIGLAQSEWFALRQEYEQNIQGQYWYES